MFHGHANDPPVGGSVGSCGLLSCLWNAASSVFRDDVSDRVL